MVRSLQRQRVKSSCNPERAVSVIKVYGGNRSLCDLLRGLQSINSGSCLLKTSEMMSTCEENDDLLNIFNLISNIKEDLRKLKLLEIPSDENGITKIKVYISRKYVAFDL